MTLIHYEALEVLLGRVKAEYLEMPGLHLTPAQVSRLMAIDPAICDTILLRLVSEGFLRRTPRGVYCRPGAAGDR